MAKSGCLHSPPNSHAPSFRAIITPPRRHSRHPRHSRVGESIQRGKGNTTVPLDSPRTQSYRLSAVRLASLILTARRESRVPTYGAPRRHSRAWPLVAGGIQKNKGNRLPTAPSFSRLPRRHCPLRRAITAPSAPSFSAPQLSQPKAVITGGSGIQKNEINTLGMYTTCKLIYLAIYILIYFSLINLFTKATLSLLIDSDSTPEINHPESGPIDF